MKLDLLAETEKVRDRYEDIQTRVNPLKPNQLDIAGHDGMVDGNDGSWQIQQAE